MLRSFEQSGVGAFLRSRARTASAAGPGVALGFGDGLRDRAPFRWNRRRLEADRLSEQCLEGLEVRFVAHTSSSASPVVLICKQRIVTAIAKLEAGNRLRVTAVEALGHAQDRREGADRLAQR